ncbi:MAG: NifB/NifX family molybdenum-iron cluster-binding protein [Sphaerochaeta sp.]
MQQIRVAIATDDEKTCITRHFGDAHYYCIYDIDERGSHFIVTLENTVDVEEQESDHGDPRKASGIGLLLKEHQVNTAVSKVFGPNIKRLLKRYACVLVTDTSIPLVLDILLQEQNRIVESIEAGEARTPVDLRKHAEHSTSQV